MRGESGHTSKIPHRTKGVARGGARGPGPSQSNVSSHCKKLIMNKFSDFWLSWDMSKMHYISNKFSKISKRWGLSSPSCFLIIDSGHLKLRDLAKLCFAIWLWRNRTLKNQLWRHFSNDIVITSPKNVTNQTSQDFSILGPFQSKFLATSVPRTLYVFDSLA